MFRGLRDSSGIAFLSLLFFWPGHADSGARQSRTLSQTALEAFAARPDATTTWRKTIGRLDGETAYATIAAVAIRSPASTPDMMRGIRIELHHQTPPSTCYLKYVEWAVMCEREPAVVYVAEDRLDALRADALNGRAEVHPGHPMGITHYRSSLGGWGLLLFGYSIQGRTLQEFATMVAAAQAELVTAPR